MSRLIWLCPIAEFALSALSAYFVFYFPFMWSRVVFSVLALGAALAGHYMVKVLLDE